MLVKNLLLHYLKDWKELFEAGKAAGVQVVQADGSPGGMAKIRIRGGSSLIGGNDPLYIIDGVQITIQNKYVQSQADVRNPVEAIGCADGRVVMPEPHHGRCKARLAIEDEEQET
ncbi:MAG: hypothetical protein EOP45_10830 [Sphingobacteriaceae bacterium]|nr:MAG: hypothetical protein EOP45_10830 [Sphingobacteriaceae bacterium]